MSERHVPPEGRLPASAWEAILAQARQHWQGGGAHEGGGGRPAGQPLDRMMHLGR